MQSNSNIGFHRRQESSTSNLSQFYSLNYLEESTSYLERTARKLLPILEQLKKRMIPEKSLKEMNTRKSKSKVETLESFREDNSDNETDMNANDSTVKTKL
jgi:hypothetical protein